jgi:hypothetical protein
VLPSTVKYTFHMYGSSPPAMASSPGVTHVSLARSKVSRRRMKSGGTVASADPEIRHCPRMPASNSL